MFLKKNYIVYGYIQYLLLMMYVFIYLFKNYLHCIPFWNTPISYIKIAYKQSYCL